MSSAKIHYLYHDGFILETKSNILIFDYFNDSSMGSRDLRQGVISEDVLKTDKNIYVFVSHNHRDHYNPVIFSWRDINPNIQYIISSDVKVKDINFKYNTISEDESIELGSIFVKAYGSTDAGVSFLVKAEGTNIFHAGDLNLWHWKDESNEDNAKMCEAFKAKIHKLEGEDIDIAFFPVDPRLEEYYYLGGKYFIEKLSPKLFVPMHFFDNMKISEEFLKHFKSCHTEIAVINKRGQEILF